MTQQLYVARRTFKAGGVVYMQGDIVTDISTVHRAELRIKEEKLVAIPNDPEGIERLSAHLLVKRGLNLKEVLKARATKGSSQAETGNPSAKATPPPGTKPVAKPVTRTVAKAPASGTSTK
jgi:hypothetical protein